MSERNRMINKEKKDRKYRQDIKRQKRISVGERRGETERDRVRKKALDGGEKQKKSH